jgi:SpoVK/Ycf46/Vps4 family AAA+-type ATPase
MGIGQTSKNIKDIFDQAKMKSPSVLFIDELDSIAFSRTEQHAHTDQKATINQLLMEMNNIKNHDVIVIGATNMLRGIDTAFKRSGRFDWKIPIFPPNEQERAELFRHYLSLTKKRCKEIMHITFELSEKDYIQLGKQSVGFTSSDIKLVCNEIRQAVLLEEVNHSLNSLDILLFVNQRKNQGLSLTKDDVIKFINEFEFLNVQSPKINFLKDEWGIKSKMFV